MKEEVWSKSWLSKQKMFSSFDKRFILQLRKWNNEQLNVNRRNSINYNLVEKKLERILSDNRKEVYKMRKKREIFDKIEQQKLLKKEIDQHLKLEFENAKRQNRQFFITLYNNENKFLKPEFTGIHFLKENKILLEIKNISHLDLFSQFDECLYINQISHSNSNNNNNKIVQLNEFLSQNQPQETQADIFKLKKQWIDDFFEEGVVLPVEFPSFYWKQLLDFTIGISYLIKFFELVL